MSSLPTSLSSRLLGRAATHARALRERCLTTPVAALSALALAASGLVLAPAHAADTTPITSGEVVAFHVTRTPGTDGDITLGRTVNGEKLDESEDTDENGLRRLVVGVGGTGCSPELDDPDLEKIGLTHGYVISPDGDLTLGWDARGVVDSAGYNGARVRLSYTGPEGGRLYIARQAEDGEGLDALMYDRNGILSEGDPVYEVAPGVPESEGGARSNSTLDLGHVASAQAESQRPPLSGDATWVFTRPGTYTIEATATGASGKSSLFSGRTEARVLVVKVGDAAIAGEDPETCSPDPDPTTKPSDNPSDDDDDDPTEEPDDPSGDDDDDPTSPTGLSFDMGTVYEQGAENFDPCVEGFSEGASVDFLLDGTRIGSALSDDENYACLTYSLPASVKPGPHVLKAVSGSRQAEHHFTVTGPTPTSSPEPTSSAKPSATPTATATAKPSATPTATATAAPTATAKPSATPTATATAAPTATAKPSATPTATATAAPTATAKPSATPKPSAAPQASLPACAPAGVTTVLDHGHVDLFDLTVEGGTPRLKLKEDVTGSGVLHDPATVLLQVAAKAHHDTLPALATQATGMTSGYLLPQTQDHSLLWPGWDTQGLKGHGYGEKVSFDITYTGPDGGRIGVFQLGSDAAPASVLADGSMVLQPSGSTIVQPYLAHTHVNWVFSASGRYTLTVTPRLTRADGTEQALAPSTYTIDAGDVPCTGLPARLSVPAAAQDQGGQPTPGSQGQGTSTGSTTTSPASSGSASSASGSATRCLPTKVTREATEEEAKTLAGTSAASTPATGSTTATDSATSATTTLTFHVGPGSTGNATEGHFDLGPVIESGTLAARVKDDRNQPASWVDPSTLTFVLGDAASLSAPEALSFVADKGKTVWMIPSTQKAGVPWLGMNSQREEIVSSTTGEVTFTLDAVNGPGKVAVFNAGELGGGVGTHVFDGAGTSYTLPRNTHAHQNWVFTEPGTYTLTLSMKVTPTGGALKGQATTTATAGTAATGLTATGEKGPNGRPMVSQTVGRTPDGQPCTLARTGTNAPALAATSASLLLAGLVLAATSRRRATRA